jgi:type IV fimbrial biogenesis protein FimU
LGRKTTPFSGPGNRRRGFSMVELVVSLAVILILSGVAVPSLTRSYRMYQMNDAASRLSGILKFTRFEAIRKNTTIKCQIQRSGTDWVIWADSIANGTLDSTETQYLMTGSATLLAGGSAPAPTAISAALSGSTLTTLSGSNNSVSYDQRGTISTPASTVYVLYIGNASIPDLGYRAVVLLPSGIIQIWTAPSGGPWQRSS